MIRVAEFNKFVADQAAENGISADLLGARIIGRWKSGAPIDLAPTQDDPALAVDPQRNNDFDFTHPNSYVCVQLAFRVLTSLIETIHYRDITSDQTRCPFSAHIRKTAPRGDFVPQNTLNHIIR
jgi:deferrochelatase/peroxidase EfeB